MNKLDSLPPTLTLSPASHFARGPARRLIVLVPDSELDTAEAAREIWELASALGGRAQFLGLCKDAAREPSLRRQMVTLSAMVADDHLSVESKIVFGRDWMETVKAHWRQGDGIACFAGQRAGLLHRPLSELLQTNLEATVHVLSGLQQSERSRWNWITQSAVWVGSLGIIAGFFWAQARLFQLPQDWAHTSLLYLSLFLEVGLIWLWNSLF